MKKAHADKRNRPAKADDEKGVTGRPTRESLDLASLPIEDPFREKKLVDDGIDTRLPSYLYKRFRKSKQSRTSYIFSSLPAIEARIKLIYEKCYEESPKETRDGILTDFVAAHPHLIFETEWVPKVVKEAVRRRKANPCDQAGKTLASIGKGFKLAANPRRYRHFLTHGQTQGAKHLRAAVSQELKAWAKSVEPDVADRTWLTECAGEKTAELIERYPPLKSCKSKLQDLLCQLNLYGASLLIAGTVFPVSERELQRNS